MDIRLLLPDDSDGRPVPDEYVDWRLCVSLFQGGGCRGPGSDGKPNRQSRSTQKEMAQAGGPAVAAD